MTASPSFLDAPRQQVAEREIIGRAVKRTDGIG